MSPSSIHTMRRQLLDSRLKMVVANQVVEGANRDRIAEGLGDRAIDFASEGADDSFAAAAIPRRGKCGGGNRSNCSKALAIE